MDVAIPELVAQLFICYIRNGWSIAFLFVRLSGLTVGVQPAPWSLGAGDLAARVKWSRRALVCPLHLVQKAKKVGAIS
jgi:hypothetical protein